MKLKITIGDKSVVATMYDNATAKDFISMLPSTLNRKLSTQGAPAGCDPDIGDVTYYAPWGNLAIFYKDFEYAGGLIKLGKIEGGIRLFKTSQTLNAIFELVE